MFASWLAVAMLVLMGGWVSGCPDGCSCSLQQGLYLANCTTLPYSGGKVEALTVIPSRDNPQELSDGQFNSARHLKYLSLRNCSIYFIHKKAFYGAKNVIEIDLSFNYIEELEPTVFQHLTSLKTLSLRGNPIQFLSDVPFLNSNSLQHLDIGQCKISSISRGVLYGLKRLKYLLLDGNLLKSLKYNTLPKGLKYLNLSHNLIVNIPTEVLSSLTNLKRIGLSGNPINCTCSLMNLQDWLSGRGVIFEDNLTCVFPPEYYGISWSKVDENRLCLAEVRRQDLAYSSKYDKEFIRQSYFNKKNSYLRENVQSDQPQTDSQAEVLFQNDETIAMGEMMRGEEGETDLTEQELPNSNKETAVEVDEENEKTEIPKVEPVEPVVEPEEANPDMTAHENVSENDHLETENINSPLDEVQESQPDEINHLPEEQTDNENNESIENTADNVSPISGNLSESNPVEFKPLNEEVNTEVDYFREEGLFHADSDRYTMSSNDTLEETTIIPDVEETTEDDILPTKEATVTVNDDDGNSAEVPAQNATSSTEINNINITDDEVKPGEKESQELEEPVPTPVFIPDLLNTKEQEELEVGTESTEPTTIPTSDTVNQTLIAGRSNVVENKLKELAGAEVVMFCIAVLVICLVLYSIFKCRTSNKRQTIRINKDVESSRGTEMQDMASLLPKPQDEEQRNGSKYPDKAPSSETMKLIGEQNENEIPRYKQMPDGVKKIDVKNTLNNNAPSSPTARTPLIKPGNPITINPAAPIQRTKVKVGVIPDSIPRTPIFLQKSLNGTKNV